MSSDTFSEARSHISHIIRNKGCPNQPVLSSFGKNGTAHHEILFNHGNLSTCLLTLERSRS